MNTGPLFDKYVKLDSTTPWYEFLLYLESCQSLNVKPSITRFVKYNRYFNQHGK